MNTEHRYILEKGSKKYHCPECTKKRFVRYIDIVTENYLPEQYGRCDRETQCGYCLNPYKNGYAKMIMQQEQGKQIDWKPQQFKTSKINISKEAVFIPVEVLKRTLSGYEKNVFIQNLLSRVSFPFEIKDIERVISLYNLGTVQHGYRYGAITFPFIDINNNVRAIQVKQFDEMNHTTGTDFLHSIIEKHHNRNKKRLPEWLETYSKNETKVSCLFGEHLLSKYPHNPIALVEAPKTALYGSLYFGFPEESTNLLWLAVYNLSSINLNKCQALKGRKVYLFPDLSRGGKAFELWSYRAKEIQRNLKGTYFKVSDLLEKLAHEHDKLKGYDLADYLIKQDWRLFRKQNIHEKQLIKPPSIQTLTSEKNEKSEPFKKTFSFNEIQPEVEFFKSEDYPFEKKPINNWDKEINQLENYYLKLKSVTQLIKLSDGSTVSNVSLFFQSHLNILKANNGNNSYLPYLYRLNELKEELKLKERNNTRAREHRINS